MSEEVHHTMRVTTGPPYEGEDTKYISVFFPDLGNMTITYRTDFSTGDEAHAFISVDFDTDKIIVIDKNGSDRSVE